MAMIYIYKQLVTREETEKKGNLILSELTDF